MSGVPSQQSPWVWQEKQQSVCTPWARHAGLWASGLGTHPTPSLGGPDACVLTSTAPLPPAGAPRGGGVHIPGASSFLVHLLSLSQASMGGSICAPEEH